MPDPMLSLRFLLLVFGGLVNREQTKVIAYLREENRVLRQQVGGRVRLDAASAGDSPRRAGTSAAGCSARLERS